MKYFQSKQEPLIYTRAWRAVQENKKTVFRLGQYKQKQQRDNKNIQQSQASPRTVSPADTTYITHTHTHTHTHTPQ